MASETTVTGLSELQNLLDQLPANIEKKLMRGALRAGQKVVAKQAMSAIHTVSGELANSVRISTSARGSTVKAAVKVGNTKAFYAHMVEFGTAAHLIEPKNGTALLLGGKEYSHLDHPGAQKRPFMRPALDAESEHALAVIANFIKNRLETKHGLDTSAVVLGEST